MKHCIRLPQLLPSFDLACKKQVSVSPSWSDVQTFAIAESVIFLEDALLSMWAPN